MKKLALFLAMLLCLTSVSALAAEIDPSSLDPYEIVWYTVGDVAANEDAVMAEINAYLTERFNATLRFVKVKTGEIADKLQNLVAAQEKFDIIFVSGQYPQYVGMNAFYPLKDLMAEYGQAYLEKWPANLWQSVTIGGDYYAIPTHKFSCNHYYYCINVDDAKAHDVDTDWINDESLSVAEKWEAFQTFCMEMKDAGAGVHDYVANTNVAIFQALYPYEAIYGSNLMPGVCVIGVGSFANVEHNQVINQFATPEFKEFCEDVYALNQYGALPQDPDTSAGIQKGDPTQAIQDSMAKRLAGYEQSWGVAYWGEEKPVDLEPYFVNYAYQTTDKIYGSMNAISATSGDPERVMMFLNALAEDPAFANLVLYGREGIDYTRNEQGQIVKNKDLWYVYEAYYPAFIIAEPDTSLPANMVEMYNEFAKTLTPSDNVGFAFDVTPVQTENAAIAQIVNQYVEPLCHGLVNPETEIPKLLAELEAAGVDAYLEEMQKQVDEWRESMGI